MTTQHDERAELVRWLELEAIPHRPSSHSRKMLLKAAALLEADAKGGEAVEKAIYSEWMTHAQKAGWLDQDYKAIDVAGANRSWHTWRAAANHYTRPQQAAQVPLTDEQEQFLNFLYGSGEFMGCWFDERHPTKKGAYWWRKEMRRIFPERDSHGIGKEQATVGINGLTEAETAASASVMGLTSKSKEQEK